MPRMRLGVVLLVPSPQAEEIDGLRRALGDPALDRVPAHLTLVPPVNVADRDLRDALDVLAAAAAATRPFTLLLGPPATFWPDNPVVHLPADGDVAAVEDLRLRVFRAPLARPLTWPFVPHVTIADDAAPGRIEAAVSALSSYRTSVRFERVHLLQEGPQRRWTVAADAAFRVPAVVGRGGLPIELTVSAGVDPLVTRWADAAWADEDRRDVGTSWEPDAPFAITARREGAVVGLGEGTVRGEVCELRRLIVDRDARAQGVGSHVLAEVESLAAASGCRVCRLRAVAGGRAEHFYRARGWVETGTLPDWRWGRDFVRMERRLG
ncbi:MAG TPA: GNAT family N-acetyltransferase [Acidimicrobiales bacterium]|jgi:2'-5' RNA ligase|nr:GNAT family N-acetyltransferase [Acidimicrobiales bacterium]